MSTTVSPSTTPSRNPPSASNPTIFMNASPVCLACSRAIKHRGAVLATRTSHRTIMRIFLTHVPDMLENYYGPRALAEMRKLGEVRLNTSGKVLDAKALADAAKGCEIIVSDRQTPGPAQFFPLAADCCAFLRVAVDIRNIDVEAASAQGILVTRATPGFIPSVSEMAIGMMIDCARKITDSVIEYRNGCEAEPRRGIQLNGATVGIMGYGAIAHHLAPICLALGMHVLISDPYTQVEDF